MLYFTEGFRLEKKKNTIFQLQNDEGVWCTEELDVMGIDIKYFQDLFTSLDPSIVAEVMDVVFLRVLEEMNVLLMRPYQEEEVRTIIFQTQQRPLPGQYTSSFFSKFMACCRR